MKHSISSTPYITDTSTYIQLSLHPKTMMAYRGHGGNLSYMCDISRQAATQCGPADTTKLWLNMLLARTTRSTKMLLPVYQALRCHIAQDCTWHWPQWEPQISLLYLQRFNTVSHVAVLLLCSQFLKWKLWFEAVKIQFKIMLCPNICILMAGKSTIQMFNV